MADKINAAGYETKPWWPYVKNLQDQISGGGSGGGGDIVHIPVIKNEKELYITTADPLAVTKAIEDGKEIRVEYENTMFDQYADAFVSIPVMEYDKPSNDSYFIRTYANYTEELNMTSSDITLYWARFDIYVYPDDIRILVTKYKEVVTSVK